MNQQIWGDNQTQFFFHLGPSLILDCIDLLGYKTTGRCLGLNSMENRVYEIEVEDRDDRNRVHSLIAKFYRPGRWSQEQILEEHQFLLDLEEEELPVIAPLVHEGQTLFQVPEYEIYYCLFPRKGGRTPDELNDEALEILGRTLARIHNVGAQRKALYRLQLNPTTFGRNNLELLKKLQVVPPHFAQSMDDAVNQICQLIDPLFENLSIHRIHGDCHRSNMIYRDGPFLIDFDDMLIGPAVQDVWMIIPGDDEQALRDRNLFLENYELMRDFDYRTLKLIEPLRALRFIHFAAWMAKRWDDPAFKRAFPYFGSDQYWSELIRDLFHQVHKIQGNNPF